MTDEEDRAAGEDVRRLKHDALFQIMLKSRISAAQERT
jgi:hypothetical protein